VLLYFFLTLTQPATVTITITITAADPGRHPAEAQRARADLRLLGRQRRRRLHGVRRARLRAGGQPRPDQLLLLRQSGVLPLPLQQRRLGVVLYDIISSHLAWSVSGMFCVCVW
jgi:hypothetical protein